MGRRAWSTSARSPSPQTRIAAFVAAALLIGAFLLAFRYTAWGVAMRAAAENPETAALMGVRLGRVSLGRLGGRRAPWPPSPRSSSPSSRPPDWNGPPRWPRSRPSPRRSSAASTPPPAPSAGGLIVGVTEAMATGYQSELTFLGRGIGDLAPYLVMVVVLLVRPAGLFGTKELARV